MIQLEYTKEITAAGFGLEQAVIYEVLLKIGESPASAITKEIPANIAISRPLTYKVLEELISLDLVEKHDYKGKIATFIAKHPIAISKAIDREKEKIIHIKEQFTGTSGKLSSIFNLTSGKPGVQFYEGTEGVWEVLMDSLTSTEEILSYADLGAIEKYIPEMNAEYSAMREEKKVKKRGLVIDSPEARKFLSTYDGAVTSTKLIKSTETVASFQTIVQIYDQKVSYITLTDKYFVGVIITDQHIANTQKYLFKSMWDNSTGEIV